MATQPKVVKLQESRYNSDYIVNQFDQLIVTDSYVDWHRRIYNFENLVLGDMRSVYPGNALLPSEPLVENKAKNALQDIKRLALDTRGATVFTKKGDTDKAAKEAQVRESIADTIWDMGEGSSIEGKLYMDLVGTGVMAVAAYYNKASLYPQFQRLDPRFCYPTIRNDKLVDLMYTERIKLRVLNTMYSDLNILGKKDEYTDDEAELVTYYCDTEVVECIILKSNEAGRKAGRTNRGFITQRWEHKLDCVPVSFELLDSFNGSFRGLLDQVGGPMKTRNTIARFLVDYMESMVHAPFEAKGILNADDEPGPTTIYQHDPNNPNTHFGRVAPAAPSGSVFGVLQYLEGQEGIEAVQPPSRVGQVSQSIASASFVNSTQGSLTSVVKECQTKMASLRYHLNVICMQIDEKYLNKEKPVTRPVGRKLTYTPKKDIGGWYHHKIEYGAASGLDRSAGDVRVLQHMGAGLISHETAAANIDYVNDPTTEQEKINKETIASAVLQRFATDPNIPMAVLAAVYQSQADGKTLLDSIRAVAPQLLQLQEQQAAAAAPQGAMPEGQPGMDPAMQQQALAAGGTDPNAMGMGGPPGQPTPPPEFAKPASTQIFVTPQR